ncbi:MAG: hypothetical protein B7Z42_16690, partial [Brevundimonas sp. 12-68-7]
MLKIWGIVRIWTISVVADAPIGPLARIPAMKRFLIAAGLAASALLSGCITSPGPGGGPPPVAQVDAGRLYTGAWHEIAFRPNWLLEGCVAGVTLYTPTDKPNQVHVRDSCRDKTLDGPEKVVEGTGHI